MSSEKRQRMLLVLAGLGLGLLVLDKILLDPLADLWKERSARIELLRTSVQKGETLMARASFLDRRWNEMQERSLEATPSQAENEVLSQVDDWSRDAGLNISSVTPQWRESDEGYSTIDVRLAGTTSIEALVGFVHMLDQKQLPLRVDQLALTSRDKSGRDLAFEMRFSGLKLGKGEGQ